MGGLTQDGMADFVSRDKSLRRAWGEGDLSDLEQNWHLYKNTVDAQSTEFDGQEQQPTTTVHVAVLEITKGEGRGGGGGEVLNLILHNEYHSSGAMLVEWTLYVVYGTGYGVKLIVVVNTRSLPSCHITR